VLLADALSLTGQVLVLFVAAGRGRAPAAEVLAARSDGAAGGSAAAATRSLPRDIGSLTGRGRELAGLLGTLAGMTADGGPPGICVIDGMAGVGKTTLAVHAAHRLTGSFPDGQPLTSGKLGHLRVRRSVPPPRGHALAVVLDKGAAARGSGRAVEQGLSVQQGPQPGPCPVATATPATGLSMPG